MLDLRFHDLDMLEAEHIGCMGYDALGVWYDPMSWGSSLSSAPAPSPSGAPAPTAKPVPQEPVASRLAQSIASGNQDENSLTDLEFNARHPERGGAKIQKGDKALAKEWLSLRDDVVRPALAKAPGGVPRPASGSASIPAVPPAPGSNAAVAEQVAGTTWSRLDTQGKVALGACGVVGVGAVILLLREIIRGR